MQRGSGEQSLIAVRGSWRQAIVLIVRDPDFGLLGLTDVRTDPRLHDVHLAAFQCLSGLRSRGPFIRRSAIIAYHSKVVILRNLLMMELM